MRDLLLDATTRLDIVGSEQTSQAARTMVEEDLAPVFLGEDWGASNREATGVTPAEADSSRSR